MGLNIPLVLIKLVAVILVGIGIGFVLVDLGVHSTFVALLNFVFGFGGGVWAVQSSWTK